jgi:hypothetical protein
MKVPNNVLKVVARFAAEGTHPTITPEERELVWNWAKAGIAKREADAKAFAESKASGADEKGIRKITGKMVFVEETP